VGGGEIFNWACNLAQEVAKALLENIDGELMRERDRSLEVECLKEHQVTTVFGSFRVRRRLYRSSHGDYRFLLDEKMGLDKGCHISRKVKELATFVCSHFPFQRSEEVLRVILPSGISHTTLHRLVGKVTDPYLEEEEKVEEVYEGGVIPESEGKVVPYLFIEADGSNIALQREEAKRAEVKAGVAYEGWEEVSKDRYRVTEKTVYTGIMDGDRFWEGFSLTLAKKYDLSKVGRVVIGGDGASWVKEGAELLGGIYELDKFHLKRALNQTLDKELAAEAYRACIRLRGLGAIEGNVDKLVANRMKKRGMSWTIKGARRMARLISLREMGKLHSWITHKDKPGVSGRPKRETIKAKQAPGKDNGAWLEVGLPALYGPHQNRPWAKILRALAHESFGGLT